MTEPRVELLITDAEHKRVALSQKTYLHELATKIEAGETLEMLEQKMAAGCIRAFADNIPLMPKRKRGQRKEWDHGGDALVFVTLRAGGKSPAQCYAEIADRNGVSDQAVEKAMRKHAPGAAALMRNWGGMENLPSNLFRD